MNPAEVKEIVLYTLNRIKERGRSVSLYIADHARLNRVKIKSIETNSSGQHQLIVKDHNDNYVIIDTRRIKLIGFDNIYSRPQSYDEFVDELEQAEQQTKDADYFIFFFETEEQGRYFTIMNIMN